MVPGRKSRIWSEMNDHFWRATLVLFIIILPISTIGYARAHDHQRPELNGWYASFIAAKGPAVTGRTRSALMMPIGTPRTITIAYASTASGLMFRKTLL